MRWIDAGNLKYWYTAKGRHCQDHLSELVSRLLSATDPSSKRKDFPAGQSVITGGLDGYLDTPTASPHFPQGESVWEMSADNLPGKQADKNHKKRTRDSHGVTISNATFVFVTPRPFPDRRKWEAKKRKLKKWKDVRVVAGDELVGWLAVAPGVAKWLAREIGLPAADSIRDIKHEWDIWSAGTEPAMTPAIVISGRSSDVQKVHNWLSSRPSVLELQGDSADEARAFLYAALTLLSGKDHLRAVSRCLVVQTRDQFQNCVDSFRDLIIAGPAERTDLVGYALNKGHHVFLAMNAEAIDLTRIVQLSRPKRPDLQRALQDAGLTEANAEKYARECGQSVPVLRRRLLRASAKEPAWAEAEAANVLLPALLAGAWVEDKEGDRKVLETLSGKSYEELARSLETLAAAEDAPVRKVGTVWMLKAPLDAWFLAARRLTPDYLKRFRHTINSVLSKADPKYDLPIDKQWAASIYGKDSPYSGWLRKGLVESLVLFGVYSEDLTHTLSSPQSFANSVVGEILGNAHTWEIWSSLKDVTPLLAEAGPESFLDVLEEKLSKAPGIFPELMRDSDARLMFDECKHSGLLWALESLAWHPSYFSRAAHVLYGLSKIDPGGRWSNRPFNSLAEILLPGFPQTYATPAQRLTAFDSIIKQDAEFAWRVVERLLNSNVISESHRFRWRDSGGEKRSLDPESKERQQEYSDGLVPRWVALVSASPLNLASAINNFLRLPEEIRESALDSLKTICVFR